MHRYRGRNQSVGAHADQLTYLGPWPTIASISLGCQRVFRLRGGEPIRCARLMTNLSRFGDCYRRSAESIVL